MSRYSGPVCRLCRREGTKLFLKGTRCLPEKCAIERRAYPPGQHGNTGGRVKKMSEYAKQLREKQKVKRIYGLQERQFRGLFERAAHQEGVTGENLLVSLETRLDNVVFRLGFALNRASARQLVRHRHVQIDGKLVDVPSFQVKPGMEVAIRPKSKDLMVLQQSLEARSRPALSEWLALDQKAKVGRMVRRPSRQDIDLGVQEQLIVELYSK